VSATVAGQTGRDGPSRAVLADETSLRRWTLAGYLILALSFGGFGLWSALAPLSSAVVAQGIVKVDSSRKRVQHLEGGIVKEILVRDGDRVQAGDVLIRLDETRAGASHGIVQAGYDAAIAHQARLIAERDGRAEIEFPPDLKRRAADPKIGDILKAQNEIFRARKASIAGQLDILSQQVLHLEKQIQGLTAQQQSKETQLASLRTELDGLEKLLAQGMVEKTKVRNIEREIAKLDGERGAHISEIAAARASISEKELQKFQIRKRFQEEVVAELRKSQSEVFDLLERSSATRHVLENTEIRAPVNGTVVDLRIHTAGGVINPSEVLMEVVPESDRLIVEGRVRPEDIDRVAVKLETGVRLLAFNQRTTPELVGHVSYVSADSIQEEKTGLTFFLIRVEVPEAELKRLGDQPIQPGMVADVFVRTGERTFVDYLLKPILDSFSKAWRER
jgi:HlyD family type I secretion membrane fusion protein